MGRIPNFCSANFDAGLLWEANTGKSDLAIGLPRNYVVRIHNKLCVATARSHEKTANLNLDERAAEARAQSGAAWRASLIGASRSLSWGCVEFAPLHFQR